MGQLRACWCLTWGVAEAKWPSQRGQTGKGVVNHSEELRCSPEDNKKQGKLMQGVTQVLMMADHSTRCRWARGRDHERMQVGMGKDLKLIRCGCAGRERLRWLLRSRWGQNLPSDPRNQKTQVREGGRASQVTEHGASQTLQACRVEGTKSLLASTPSAQSHPDAKSDSLPGASPGQGAWGWRAYHCLPRCSLICKSLYKEARAAQMVQESPVVMLTLTSVQNQD